MLAVQGRMHCLTGSKNLLEGTPKTQKGAAHFFAFVSSQALSIVLLLRIITTDGVAIAVPAACLKLSYDLFVAAASWSAVM